MAQFQISVSKTYTVDTDDYENEARDSFAEALTKVGWKPEDKKQPTTQQCEDAARWLLENDDVFYEATIDLSEIETKDMKIVCISRQFEPNKPPVPDAARGVPDGQKTASGVRQVAEPLKQPHEGPQESVKSEGKSDSPVDAKKPAGTQTTTPAPKVEPAKPPVQGARDSTQIKK